MDIFEYNLYVHKINRKSFYKQETQPDMLVTTKSVDRGQHDDKDDLNNTIRNSKASETQKERDDLAFHFLNVNTVSYTQTNLESTILICF
jgi:hypothetical protein